ncbi:hypothetical protein NX059_010967 [Plenodomus lindquistii]|nr:hypothetical protein NX059_010967 [Plenodomus lindquistii]
MSLPLLSFGYELTQSSQDYNIAIITLLRHNANERSSACELLDGDTLDLRHQRACLDAAQDMIEHIHQSFEIAPGLRRWSYYCFYCLQAVLVLLPKVADDFARYRRQHRVRRVHDADTSDPSLESNVAIVEKHKRLCDMAIEVFEKIQLKASRRCADVVRQFLERWARKTEHRSTRMISVPESENADVPAGTYPLPSVARSGRVPKDLCLTPGSQAPTDQQPECLITDDTVEFDSGGTRLAPSISGSNYTSPPVSVNGLQTELYGALYCTDSTDGFLVANQLFPFNFEYLDNDQAIVESQDSADASWHQTDDLLDQTQPPFQAQ